MDKKQVRYDIDGYEDVTPALRELLNQYPGIADGDRISFSTLDAESGKTMVPITGAVIETERRYITGIVEQTCLYPFHLVYRASGISENGKAGIKEWLDNIGRWLEKQPVNIGDETYKLEEYPALTAGRRILSIERATPAYLDGIAEDMSETWVIQITARYRNEFKK